MPGANPSHLPLCDTPRIRNGAAQRVTAQFAPFAPALNHRQLRRRGGHAVVAVEQVVTPDAGRASFGAGIPVIPGMTGEVAIQSGSQTILNYVLGPLIRISQEALRE